MVFSWGLMSSSQHPQLFPINVGQEPQALQNARPETNLSEQRVFQYGFNPVGFKPLPGLIEDNVLQQVLSER